MVSAGGVRKAFAELVRALTLLPSVAKRHVLVASLGKGKEPLCLTAPVQAVSSHAIAVVLCGLAANAECYILVVPHHNGVSARQPEHVLVSLAARLSCPQHE